MKSHARIIVFVLICWSSHTYAQDPHFSQFFEAPLLRNPSLAGLFAGDIRVQAVYRNQWGSVTVPYQTGSFNIEYKQPVGRGNDFFLQQEHKFYTTVQALPILLLPMFCLLLIIINL